MRAPAQKLFMSLMGSVILFSHAPAQAQVAQKYLDSVLYEFTANEIASMRSICALGQETKHIENLRAAGFQAPSAGASCVTVLTRAGRDGKLGYVSDPRTSQLTPAMAFDSGFVAGYLKREALPADAPAMAALLPIADRCLDQKEANTNLCNAVGQMLGARAARGEVVALR